MRGEKQEGKRQNGYAGEPGHCTTKKRTAARMGAADLFLVGVPDPAKNLKYCWLSEDWYAARSPCHSCKSRRCRIRRIPADFLRNHQNGYRFQHELCSYRPGISLFPLSEMSYVVFFHKTDVLIYIWNRQNAIKKNKKMIFISTLDDGCFAQQTGVSKTLFLLAGIKMEFNGDWGKSGQGVMIRGIAAEKNPGEPGF